MTTKDRAQEPQVVALAKPRIYELPEMTGGWCKLSDVAEMLGCSELEVLHRFGPLSHNTHHLTFACLEGRSWVTFSAHWMSIVATGGRRCILGASPTSPYIAWKNVRVKQLFVPAGWVEDIIKFVGKGAANVFIMRLQHGSNLVRCYTGESGNTVYEYNGGKDK